MAFSFSQYLKFRVSFLRMMKFSRKYLTSFMSAAFPRMPSISTDSSDDSEHSGGTNKLN